MAKPSIAELLRASGYTEFTQPLILRAMYSLYGNIGANLDERDWSAILQGSDPLQASEEALSTMYQDSGYLLRNTQHLTQSGYVAAQAEITYRQMAGRLGYSYSPAWSDGTAYDYLGDLSYEQLVSLVPAPPPPPLLPTISVSASVAGFTVALSVAGTVKLSVSGDLGSFAAGSTVLPEQTTLKQGFLTLAANGNTSAASSQYVVLGTNGDDIVDFSTLASRVDYIFGGAGNDTIRGGEGNDVLLGGTGNDTIFGNEDDDLIYGGEGNDIIQAGQGNDTVYGGDGNDSISGGTTGDDVLDGDAGNDTITGDTGNDTITGGAGVDQLDGGTGTDTYRYVVAGESSIINAASAASGFDTVTITSGDVFDFSADVTVVRGDEYYVGQSPKTNGDELLVQLNSFYQSAGPSLGVDAMYISIGNNNKGRFLVVDTDDNNQINSNDLIIEIVGITNNKNIQLGLSGGNVVMNEVDHSDI